MSDVLATNTAELPFAWAAACADVVEKLDEPDMLASLAQSLSTLLPFDECKQVVHFADAHPVLMFDSTSRHEKSYGLENYLESSYAISPFYRFYKSGAGAGVYRLRDIAHYGDNAFDPKTYRVARIETEEIGYLTEGLTSGNEELCIALAMPNGACALIALLRKRSRNGYALSELGRVAATLPFLSAAFRRHWVRYGSPDNTPVLRQDMWALSTNGNQTPLTPREVEVIDLLLHGHSSLSISLRLEIAVTTVKTHRKNIYAKLNISTQYELFSLCAGTDNRVHPSVRHPSVQG